jgi:hypothetical protein
MWAATFLLPIQEKEAIRALELITAEDGIHSLTSRTTIQEWQNGRLKL